MVCSSADPAARNGKSFNIPDLSGKVILVTGGNAGLGKATILALSAHNPSHIYLLARSAARATTAIQEIQSAAPSCAPLTFIPCDLSSLSSVRAAAAQILRSTTRLDILICNAGIMVAPPTVTPDGYGIHIGTNHLGHALLIQQLLPLLQQTASSSPAPGADADADVRIVLLTSKALALSPGIDFAALTTPQARLYGGVNFLGTYARYGQSKLANRLYAAALARRYPAITSVAVHPGVVAETPLVAGLGRAQRWFVYVTSWMAGEKVVGVREGVRNQVWAATGRREDVRSGGFYEPVGVRGRETKWSVDERLERELWEWTQRELERFGG